MCSALFLYQTCAWFCESCTSNWHRCPYVAYRGSHTPAQVEVISPSLQDREHKTSVVGARGWTGDEGLSPLPKCVVFLRLSCHRHFYSVVLHMELHLHLANQACKCFVLVATWGFSVIRRDPYLRWWPSGMSSPCPIPSKPVAIACEWKMSHDWLRMQRKKCPTAGLHTPNPRQEIDWPT